MQKLSNIRRDYKLSRLEQEQLNPDPIVQFEQWLAEVIELEIPDPTAMTIATVDASGQPSQRIVLLKDLSQRGFVFYTNTESRKANELAGNNKISLHFPWHGLERQVKVCGIAKALPVSDVAKYFVSRPRESQLAAWASQQSRAISSRQLLMHTFARMKQKFSQGEIPLPSFWGGYVVEPHQIEFWQGGEHRLHDRFEYNKQSDGSWQIERLMP